MHHRAIRDGEGEPHQTQEIEKSTLSFCAAHFSSCTVSELSNAHITIHRETASSQFAAIVAGFQLKKNRLGSWLPMKKRQGACISDHWGGSGQSCHCCVLKQAMKTAGSLHKGTGSLKHQGRQRLSCCGVGACCRALLALSGERRRRSTSPPVTDHHV